MIKRNYVFAGTKKEQPMYVRAYRDNKLKDLDVWWIHSAALPFGNDNHPYIFKVAEEYKSLGRIYLN